MMCLIPKRLYLLVTASCLAGCASVKSTAINRVDSDVFIGDSNGKPKVHCSARPFNGVPVTLRVPTHLDVAIQEKLLFICDGKTMKRHMGKRNFSVHTELVRTEKVFTVDPKRPAAGQLNYKMRFGANDGNVDNSQYFSELDGFVVDRTIADVTLALRDITNALEGKGPTKKPGATPEPKDVPAPAGAAGAIAPAEATVTYIPEVRTVAWQRFDIDSPTFEQDVAAFVELHMNRCHSCEN